MSADQSLLGVFERAWDATPSQFLRSGRNLTNADLESLLEQWALAETVQRSPTKGIWPLLSHHTFGGRTLFRDDSGTSILPRALTLLLAHDGLVAADPLFDVQALIDSSRPDQARRRLLTVMEGLAAAEPLIRAGLLRFTAERPGLSDPDRSAVLNVFGLDSYMTVFRNFLEAAGTVAVRPRAFDSTFRPQMGELYRRLSLRLPQLKDVDDAAGAIQELGASFIEVSWQLAVCARDGRCDLALDTELELEIMDIALASIDSDFVEVWEDDLGATRHFRRLSLGELPNLDTGRLTAADAVAIRRNDVFEAFRQLLSRELDVLDQDANDRGFVAQQKFQDRMKLASQELLSQVQRTTLRSRLIAGTVPAGLASVSAAFVHPDGPVLAASAAAGGTFGGVVWDWLVGRATSRRLAPARRYMSMLTGTTQAEIGG